VDKIELSEKFSVMLKDRASISDMKSKEDFGIGFAFPGSTFPKKMMAQQAPVTQSQNLKKQPFVAGSLDFSKSNLGDSKLDMPTEMKTSAIKSPFREETKPISEYKIEKFKPNPEIEKIKKLYLKKEDIAQIREKAAKECKMDMIRK
jgi:hypothetical protein